MWQSVSNNLKIFIDPLLFNNKHLNEEINIGLMEDYLKRSLPKICNVVFYYPVKVAEAYGINKRFSFKNIINIEQIPTSVSVNELLSLLKNIQDNKKEIQDKVSKFNDEILNIATKEKCHLFVTDSPYFLEDKNRFNNKNILIVDINTLITYIEVFLSGFYNFFKFNFPAFGITNPDMAHLMSNRLFMETISKLTELTDLKDQVLIDFFRTLFYNRYPDLLITIDKIKFYYIQRNIYVSERGKTTLPEYDGYLRYYIYVYYSLLWTMCDNTAWILNYIYKLGYDVDSPRDWFKIGLSIKKDEFFGKLEKSSKALHGYISDNKFQEWLNVVAEVRHQNSHRNSCIASALYTGGGEVDKMTDEEIDKVLYPDGKVLENQELFSNDFIENQKRLDRTNYKLSKMEKTLDTFIVLNKNGKKSFFDPIARIKVDMNMIETLYNNIYQALKPVG